MPRLLAILVLLFALTACGFQLRDALQLPPDLGPVRVVARDPYSPLATSLAVALENAGATAAAADAEADDVATLNVVSEQWASRPISVDQFGRAQEYTLLYAVVFSLDRADGRNVVPQQAVELSRDYISVPTRSTGTDSERELLAREMRRDMTASILRRIDAASRAPMLPAVQGDAEDEGEPQLEIEITPVQPDAPPDDAADDDTEPAPPP